MRHLRSFRYFLAVLALAAGLAPQAEAATVSVTTSTELQNAINTAPDGTIIELAAGTYNAPTGGFAINDRGTSFTIRAASGATVTLSGNSVRDILRFINSSLAAGGPVTFQDLIFANGQSSAEGLAGGVTLQRARATFINCTFQNNQTQAMTTGGGGVLVAVGSVAHFINSTFSGNSAKAFGGGLAVEDAGTDVTIHNSTFLNNKTNIANHNQFSAGGGIHVGNGNAGVVKLQVTNTRFEGNEAGYVGGGLYVLGSWGATLANPTADVVVSNSYFLNNKAKLDVTVPFFGYPTEGGGMHVEDHARARIYHSRFETNSADTGGGLNLYRAEVIVDQSVFLGNKAVGLTSSTTGFGGAISAVSNDANDATTNSGTTNRRSSSLTVTKSLLQGRYGSTTTAGQNGGCLYAAGDSNMMYGQNGVSQNGTVETNRATVSFTNSVFHDCDVAQTNGVGSTGRGGAIFTDLVAFTLTGSIVMNSDAVAGSSNGSDAWAGAALILNQSAATMTNSMFAKNTAVCYGGAIMAQGSTLTIDNSKLVKNSLTGPSSGCTTPKGGTLVTGPMNAFGGKIATGEVKNSTISEGSGGTVPVWEFDSTVDATQINTMTYKNNQMRPASGTNVFESNVAAATTVAGLNTLVVNRSAGGNTDKAPSNDNTAPGSDPVVGQILVVPTERIAAAAPSESTPTVSYVGYAWGGSASATLDSVNKTSQAVLESAGTAGTRTLTVSATNFTATLTNGATPAVTFSPNPSTINSGSSSQLNWATTGGTFVTGTMDQAIGTAATASGSTSVSPTATRSYRYVAATEQGGATATATVTVAGSAPTLTFTTSQVLVNAGTQITLSWTASSGASLTLNGSPVSGPTGSTNTSPGGTTTYTMVATNSSGSTTKIVTVTVNDGQSALGGSNGPTITAPTSGQAMSVTGVSFAWNAVGSAAGYDLRVFDASTGVVQFSGSLVGGSSTGTLISLPAGSYRFAVRACSSTTSFTVGFCGKYASQPFSVSPVAPTGAPSITFPTQGSTLTTSTQTLQWTAVTPNPSLAGDPSYEVLLSNLQAGTTALQINTTGLSTIFTMGSSTQYEMKVRACQAGCGPWSSTVTFAVDLPAVPVSAPVIGSCNVTGGNSLTCNWSAVTNADTYQILVVQPTSGPGGSALTVAAQQVSGLTVTVPVPSGAATVVIRACNGDGCGPDATSPINAAGPNSSSPILGSPTAGTVVSGPTVFFAWNRIPGDNGSNTTYRLYVQDLSRQAAALDVFTTSNFYSAYFKAEGARYDGLVIANPGGSQVAGPAAGFNVAGSSATAPTMVSPAHNSTVNAGNITLSWSTVPGATLYEYFVAIQGQPDATVRGVTPGLLTQVPLSGSVAGIQYSGIVRACPAGLTCQAGSETNWGPWSVNAGPGVTNFTVVVP